MLIYKILVPAEFAELEAAGRFEGSPLDVKDGYIHLSTRDQVPRTATRFFADDPELVILAVETTPLQEWLRWEMSGVGGPFPHLYTALPRTAVSAVHHIPGHAKIAELLPR